MNTSWLVMRDVSEPVKTTFNPLHRTSSVLPSGLATVVTACPASQDGLAVRSGFIGSERAPGGARRARQPVLRFLGHLLEAPNSQCRKAVDILSIIHPLALPG